MSIALCPYIQCYQDVERFILKLANDYLVRYNRLDPDEVYSAALHGFVEAHNSYDPKYEYITWVGDRIKWRLKDVLRKNAKHRAKFPISDVNPDDLPSRELRNPFDINEWINNLSEDAKLVARLVLESPIDIQLTLAQIGNDRPQSYRYAIKDFLKDLGWTGLRIATTFREIKEHL